MRSSSEWDAVVVGAGPAGAAVAGDLGARGRRVLLLDAGPRLAAGQRVPEVDRRAWAFGTEGGAFDWYRVRAVGGRALLWGGWSHRFSPSVFERNDWPYRASTLSPWYRRAERLLRVVRGTLEPRYRAVANALGLAISPKIGALAKGKPWTPLAEPSARAARTWSVALRLVREDGRSSVQVLDLRTERARLVTARAVILAASPIETARILLRSELGGRGFGRGLVDHMVASHLLLEPTPASKGAGPFPGCALVHDLVNTREDNRRPYPGGVSIEVSGRYPLEAFGVERMVPSDETSRWSATQLHALGEMTKARGRFVDLDPERTDALGRPIPRIHVAFSASERRMAEDMKQACVALADAIAVPGSKVIPFVDPLQPGAGHEAGTCAMGRDDRAPCDPWGRLRRAPDVWIADASAMPTSGDRHPTLTLIAHALRVAHDVDRRLG